MRCDLCEVTSSKVAGNDFAVDPNCGKCGGMGTIPQSEEERVMDVRDDCVIEAGQKPKVRRLL